MAKKHGPRSPLRLLTGQTLNISGRKKGDSEGMKQTEVSKRLSFRRSYVQPSDSTLRPPKSNLNTSVAGSAKKKSKEETDVKWVPIEISQGRLDECSDDVHSWSDDHLANQYCFDREIGYGNWGSCWLVKCNVTTATVEQGRQYAIKLVHRQDTLASNARVKALWNEFKVLRACGRPTHPNLATFREFGITPSYAMIVMDYYRNPMNVALPVSVYAGLDGYFYQLISAVVWLHDRYVTHCDIKVANLLVDSSIKSSYGKPILVDFGFATLHNSTSAFISTQTWGTPEYLSPERSRGDRHDERLSDVWALGITMFELATGRTPFEQMDEQFLTKEQLDVYYQRTLTGEWIGEYDIAKELEDLCQRMLHPDPKKRIFAQQAKYHRYFSSEDHTEAPASLLSTDEISHNVSEMQSDDAHPCVSVESATALRSPPNAEQHLTVPDAGGQSSWVDESSSQMVETPQHSEDVPVEQLQMTPAIWSEDARHQRVRIMVDEVADESTLSALRSQFAIGADIELGSELSSSPSSMCRTSAEDTVSRSTGEEVQANNVAETSNNPRSAARPRNVGLAQSMSTPVEEPSLGGTQNTALSIASGLSHPLHRDDPAPQPSKLTMGCDLLRDIDRTNEFTPSLQDTPRQIESENAIPVGTLRQTEVAISSGMPIGAELLTRLEALETTALSLVQMIAEVKDAVRLISSTRTSSIVATQPTSPERVSSVSQPDIKMTLSAREKAIAAPTTFSSHDAVEDGSSPKSADFDLVEIPSTGRGTNSSTLKRTSIVLGNPLTLHLETMIDNAQLEPASRSPALQSEIQQKSEYNEGNAAFETIADQNDKEAKPEDPDPHSSPRRSKVKSISLQRSGSFSQWIGKHPSRGSIAQADQQSSEPLRDLRLARAPPSQKRKDGRMRRTSTVTSRPKSEPQTVTAFHRRQASESQRASTLYTQPQSILTSKRARPVTSYAALGDASRNEHRIGNDPPRAMLPESSRRNSVTWDSSGHSHQTQAGGALWRMLTNRIATSVRSPRT